MGLTLTAKLIIMAIILAAIGYEQLWVFEQGKKVQAGVDVIAQSTAVAKAIRSEQTRQEVQRKQEVQDARVTSDKLNKENRRLVVDLAMAKKALQQPNVQNIANTPLPPDLISLLRNDDSDSTPAK